MSSGLPLQTGIIYGPVFSRRIGRSLGINLSPLGSKLCSFNCIYCEYGSAEKVQEWSDIQEFPKTSDVLYAVEKALKKPRTIAYLTFSGHGEPTLHPNFYDIVKGVKALRDRIRPECRLAVLSNASCLNRPEVFEAINLIDAPMMKLDAGDEPTFQQINRPASGLSLDAIIHGLKKIERLMLQSVLIEGEISNVRGAAYENWVRRISVVRPITVHVYSTERPTAEAGVQRVRPQRLVEICRDLRQRFGMKVEAFWREA